MFLRDLKSQCIYLMVYALEISDSLLSDTENPNCPQTQILAKRRPQQSLDFSSQSRPKVKLKGVSKSPPLCSTAENSPQAENQKGEHHSEALTPPRSGNRSTYLVETPKFDREGAKKSQDQNWFHNYYGDIT